MKKGKSKKLVAWLLAFAVLMSPSTGFRAFADDADGTGQDTAVSTVTDDQAAATEGQDSTDDSAVPDQNDPAAEGEPQEPTADDPAVTDDPAADDPAAADDPSANDPAVNDPAVTDDTSADDPADTDTVGEPAADDPSAEGEQAEDEQAEPEQADADETEEPEYEDGGQINNLFIEEHSIQAPGELNAIISFGEGSEQLEAVTLLLAGDDGRQSEIPLTQKVLNYYQFTKTYESQEAGTYRLVAFIYEQEGHKKRIDFKDSAISAQFTVAGEAGCEEAGISVTALTSDEISTDMTYEIENTIQEAAQEVVDNVNEGAVALDSSSTGRSYGRAAVSTELTAVTDQAVSLGSYSAQRAYAKDPSAMLIVLDPGHGGSDQGSSNDEAELIEKDLNLKVAKYCQKALEGQKGIKVYMTRESDTYVGLEERVRKAQQYAADNGLNVTLFVSIHMNSATTESANGAEVYYPNANGDYDNVNGSDSTIHEDGKEAAQNILDELIELGLTDRKIKYKDSSYDKYDDDCTYNDGKPSDYYSVIRNSKKNGFPGIIVEHAFISNPKDAANLKKEECLKALGEADARGILKFCDTETDYSDVFDYDYYKEKYGELLQKNNATTKDQALQYFIDYGMKSGHQASANFNVMAYKNRYSDLRAAFGDDLKLYYQHYINCGKKEGRIATDEPTSDKKPNVDAAAVYDGMNYADVYDFDFYVEHHKDMKRLFSNNPAGALEHFVYFGLTEGRQAKGTFDVHSYKNRYPDLQKAFGSNLKSYYLHYIAYGKAEGRTAVGNTTENGTTNNEPTGVTKYLGVDYAPVYNYNYYIEKYPDVKQKYASDPEGALEHFVRNGMKEGRSGNADFNVHAYKERYSDLRAAFGNDLRRYYMHYITYGQAEGRRCDMVVTTIYRGVDYSCVYNFEYYIGKYPEVSSLYENDPVGALQYYVNTGIDKGHQASEEFNLDAYKNNNDDLRKAFGDNNKAYVEHYISLGKNENRNAKSFNYHSIAKANSTYVQQMVKYFLANSTYPTYYANNTDVPTIKEFCELYISECSAEGIDAAVAFCQAMKETNFLKFTGDVKITQFNFAGIGATASGISGATFPDIQTGIRAQVQHLKAYATEENSTLANVCVDPRFQYVTRGCAKYVEWLGIQENPIPGCGWASSPGYGTSIVNDYMNKLSTY